MSAVAETAVIVVAVNGLVPWGLIAAGKLRTPAARRTATPQTTAARPGYDSALPGPATVNGTGPLLATEAVARSTRYPDLAEFAARRPRNASGRFVPLGRAS